LANKLEEPALGMEIMPVISQMAGKLLDTCGEYSYRSLYSSMMLDLVFLSKFYS